MGRRQRAFIIKKERKKISTMEGIFKETTQNTEQ